MPVHHQPSRDVPATPTSPADAISPVELAHELVTKPLDPRIDLAQSRTLYAAFRTSLAMERTTLAWVRTTLALTSFGLGIIGFFRSAAQLFKTPESERLHHRAIQFGVALVLIGVFSTIAIAIWHMRTVRLLRTGISPLPALWPLSVLLSLLLSILALSALWAIFR